jgi:hypothetical protein
VLARLDKIDGVEKSLANQSGTMIRVSAKSVETRDTVAEEATKLLTEEKREPVRLAGEQFDRALKTEQWRETGRVSELSAIEFRTLIGRRLKSFAQTEKLDEEKTDKLLKFAEEEWERLGKLAAEKTRESGASEKNEGSESKTKTKSSEAKSSARNVDWRGLRLQFGAALADRAKELLTEQQVERLKQTIRGQPAGKQDK